MAALQDALAATNDLREARKPPNLREAVGRDRCGTCAWWKPRGVMSGAGACRLYASYPTHREDVCDAFKPNGT